MNKIYCGNAKQINTQHGGMTKVLLSKEDVNTIVKYMKGQNSDFINIDIKERQSPSAKGYTHYLQVNEYKHDNQSSGSDDLPF